MNEIKLLPCPFCGKRAVMRNRVNKNGIEVFCIECKNCNSKSDWYHDFSRAVNSWNSRVIGYTKRNRADS